MQILVNKLQLFGLTFTRIFILTALSIVAAVLEGFGMAMFLPVLNYIERGGDVGGLAATSTLWARLIEIFGLLGVHISLFSLLFVAVSIMFCVYIRQIYTFWLTQEIRHVSRTNLFENYLEMNYGAFKQIGSGGQINLLTIEVQRASGGLTALFAVFSNATMVLAFVFALILISPALTGLSVFFLLFSGVVVAIAVKNTRKQSYKATDANEQYARLTLDRLRAFRLIKLTATSIREANRVRLGSERVRDLSYSLGKLSARVDLIVEPIVLLLGGGILFAAVNNLGMTLAEVGVFLLILLRIQPISKEIMKSWQTFRSCQGSLSAVLKAADSVMRNQEITSGHCDFPALTKGITFKNITLVLAHSSDSILKDVNCYIPAGKLTAIVGPSGAGKTTIAELIPRLHVPQFGEIYFDDVASSALDLIKLRRSISFVSQDSEIIDGTVAENLRFARPDATEDDLWAALALAQAARFVRGLANTIHTQLGENGITLSGGQKQRIALARAILQGAKILILDEPTSALDVETERDIQVTLGQLKSQSVTIIVVAHRISTIKMAENIIFVKDGRVANEGTHEDLIVAEKWYASVNF